MGGREGGREAEMERWRERHPDHPLGREGQRERHGKRQKGREHEDQFPKQFASKGLFPHLNITLSTHAGSMRLGLHAHLKWFISMKTISHLGKTVSAGCRVKGQNL